MRESVKNHEHGSHSSRSRGQYRFRMHPIQYFTSLSIQSPTGRKTRQACSYLHTHLQTQMQSHTCILTCNVILAWLQTHLNTHACILTFKLTSIFIFTYIYTYSPDVTHKWWNKYILILAFLYELSLLRIALITYSSVFKKNQIVFFAFNVWRIMSFNSLQTSDFISHTAHVISPAYGVLSSSSEE